MIIFLPPTKTFTNIKALSKQLPHFKNESLNLVDKLKNMDLLDIKNNFKISDKLSEKTHNYYNNFNLNKTAIYTYGGTVYKNLDPLSIPKDKLKNIYIISSLFGIINAFDAISEYRLDFTNTFLTDLYKYWDKLVNNYIKENFKDKLIINLLSKEFSNLLDKDLNNIININFYILKNNKLTSNSMQLKKLRGLMARTILLNDCKTIEDIKKIEIENYYYDQSQSTNNNLVFIKKGN